MVCFLIYNNLKSWHRTHKYEKNLFFCIGTLSFVIFTLIWFIFTNTLYKQDKQAKNEQAEHVPLKTEQSPDSQVTQIPHNTPSIETETDTLLLYPGQITIEYPQLESFQPPSSGGNDSQFIFDSGNIIYLYPSYVPYSHRPLLIEESKKSNLIQTEILPSEGTNTTLSLTTIGIRENFRGEKRVYTAIVESPYIKNSVLIAIFDVKNFDTRRFEEEYTFFTNLLKNTQFKNLSISSKKNI